MADGRSYEGPSKPTPGSTSNDPLGPEYRYTGPLAPGDQGKTPDQLNQEIRQRRGNQPAGQSGGGGGYTCDLGALRMVTQQVNAMLQATRDDLGRAQTIASVTPTAQDADGSVMFANRVRETGSELVSYVQGHANVLMTYKQHLETVERSYAKIEDSAKISFDDLNLEM